MTTSDDAVAVLGVETPPVARQGSRWRLALPVGLLAMPMLAFLAYFFFYPAIRLLFSSILTQNSLGIIGRPFTLAHYARLIDVELYALQDPTDFVVVFFFVEQALSFNFFKSIFNIV